MIRALVFSIVLTVGWISQSALATNADPERLKHLQKQLSISLEQTDLPIAFKRAFEKTIKQISDPSVKQYTDLKTLYDQWNPLIVSLCRCRSSLYQLIELTSPAIQRQALGHLHTVYQVLGALKGAQSNALYLDVTERLSKLRLLQTLKVGEGAQILKFAISASVVFEQLKLDQWPNDIFTAALSELHHSVTDTTGWMATSPLITNLERNISRLVHLNSYLIGDRSFQGLYSEWKQIFERKENNLKESVIKCLSKYKEQLDAIYFTRFKQYIESCTSEEKYESFKKKALCAQDVKKILCDDAGSTT